MVNVRPHAEPSHHPRGRFHVLLTEDDIPRADTHWTRQFSRLLEPQGVQAHVARCGQEAIELAGRLQFHAAVIELGTPRAPDSDALPALGVPGGLWLLELFHRLPQRPPVVVVNSRYVNPRDLERFLREALRLGAFSVLNQPVDLNRLLTVLRKLVDRQYRGAWPHSASS